MERKHNSSSRPELVSALQEARARMLELVSDLTDEQMIGPRLEIVNPLRWELGHVAYFQEYWILRHYRKDPPIMARADALYDSARIDHDTRWDLPLPSKAETLAYLERVMNRIAEPPRASPVGAPPPEDGYDESYYLSLGLMHEYMHAEAITYTRQTLGWRRPKISIAHTADANRDPAPRDAVHSKTVPMKSAAGDAEIPGGAFLLGAAADGRFVFDNEQCAHPVSLEPFRIARTAVTNAEFAAFVEDNGYRRSELWTPEGWRWRGESGATHPVYWSNQGGGNWLRRNFDEWVPLESRYPVLHVNWYEADAYCRWAGRRLPAEAEWEMAASIEQTIGNGGSPAPKRQYPWGDQPPRPDRANLDWRAMGCVDVDAAPAGDSAFACRQMIGNVWEWTATDFGPYPGFTPGPYKEYSAPWFENHKVLRGGCWVTRSALIRNSYRNFYRPHRRDVWAGFRTCARE